MHGALRVSVSIVPLQVPFLNSVGTPNCSVATVEDIVIKARFNSNCSSGVDLLLLALAYDRRPTLGDYFSTALLPWDALSRILIAFISVIAPLRFLSLANCASRALAKVAAAHLSPQRSAFHIESFFSDFGLVNSVMIRLQRQAPMASPPLQCVVIVLTFCCRQLGFQVLLIAMFNVVITVLCLVELQLSSVLECFRRPQNAFPNDLLYFKMSFNIIRIVSATFALACCLVPVSFYNYKLKDLAYQVSTAWHHASSPPCPRSTTRHARRSLLRCCSPKTIRF
jgi:hypothetical protein